MFYPPIFSGWYPFYRSEFSSILAHQCSSQLAGLRSGAVYCTDVVECILGTVDETVKLNMASAAVLLGLTPTILSMLGSNTTEIALISARRPLLSLCLAMGAPVVNPIFTFKYVDVREVLTTTERPVSLIRFSGVKERICILLEYILVLASIANVATVGYELGSKAILNVFCEQTFHPILWSFITIAIHLCANISFKLRYQETNVLYKEKSFFMRWYKQEFRLGYHNPVNLRVKQESVPFMVVSWVSSFLTIAHLIYGTEIFSSVTFVASRDALTVVARYMASTILCRAILVYELSGMREASLSGEHMQHVQTDTSVELRNIK